MRRVFLFFFLDFGLLFRPIGQKAVVNQIDLRLITLVHVVEARFLFHSVFVEGFSNTHTLTHIYAQLRCSPLICACVRARLGAC